METLSKISADIYIFVATTLGTIIVALWKFLTGRQDKIELRLQTQIDELKTNDKEQHEMKTDINVLKRDVSNIQNAQHKIDRTIDKVDSKIDRITELLIKKET